MCSTAVLNVITFASDYDGSAKLASFLIHLLMDDVLYSLHKRGEIDEDEFLLLVRDKQHNLHTGLPYFKYDIFNMF